MYNFTRNLYKNFKDSSCPCQRRRKRLFFQTYRLHAARLTHAPVHNCTNEKNQRIFQRHAVPTKKRNKSLTQPTATRLALRLSISHRRENSIFRNFSSRGSRDRTTNTYTPRATKQKKTHTHNRCLAWPGKVSTGGTPESEWQANSSEPIAGVYVYIGLASDGGGLIEKIETSAEP